MNFINDSIMAYSDTVKPFVSEKFTNSRRERVLVERINDQTNPLFDIGRQ
jgi:hypothetical protein